MRSRVFTVLVAAAVIVLSVAVGLMLSSTVTQQPTGGTEGAGETTTPPPTLPPETSALSSALNGITGLISDLLLIGALILGAFLVVRILSRLVRLLRARQLVVETLANSSGSDDIGKSLTGLSQLTREELSRQLGGVRREVNANRPGGGADSAHVYRSAPLVPMDENDRRALDVDVDDVPDVGNALDETLGTLLESLKGVAPDRIKWVVEFMKLAFPQKGVIVNGDLQRAEDVPSRLGITLSVSDVDNRQNRSYLTVWELFGGPSKAGLRESSKESSKETSEATSGGTPTKEVSKETTRETSDETSTEPAKAEPDKPPAGSSPAGIPPANDDSTADDSTKTTHKETSKNTTKESSKETSNETSKNVSVSKEITKETSTGQRDLTRGYIGLLKPGCRWLACEISKRERLAEVLSIPLVPQAERGVPAERAARERIRTVKQSALRGTIANFYGVLYAASAPTFSGYDTGFLQRAADQFRYAIRQFADAPERMAELRQLTYEEPEKEGIILLLWRSYLPYENLANTYSLLGRTLVDDAAEDQSATQLSNLEYQERSLFFYQRALGRVDAMPPPHSENIRRRIEINRATSQQLTGVPEQAREAREKVTDIARRPQNLAGETDFRVLYSLACWYAVADEVGTEAPDAGEKARLYLAYSLGRDKQRDLWKHASKDKDLASIGHGFVERLELELMRTRLRNPDLHAMPGAAFARVIAEVIERSASAEAD
jgi:hypothetical protein